MKPPKCRLCGHHHVGTDHVFDRNAQDTVTHTGVTHKTAAARQRRYRERHGEAYRERNRERMRQARSDVSSR